jgi:flagellar biosynthesis protein FliP
LLKSLNQAQRRCPSGACACRGTDQQADASLRVLVPAFMLSELRAAFVAGFIIFLLFLLMDG